MVSFDWLLIFKLTQKELKSNGLALRDFLAHYNT